MDNVVPMHRDAHREALLLLPWHVSGALDEAEQARVEAHLADCAECRAELALERRLATEVVAMSPQSEPAWEAMRRRLAQPARRRTRPARRNPARHAAKIALPWLGWAVAAGVMMILGVQAVLPPRPAPVYHALAAAPDHAGVNVAVIFKPQTTVAEIHSILDASQARVADGPTATDAWLLNIPMQERDAAVRRLRASPDVLAAEPLDPVGP
ncbi:MAG TPA: zf-HC2 domain-containing protein [Caulobacteraceae bacterium]|nr:zf-HC2 domain-containing protein [Caulobacteraceae bacterium]